MSYDEDFKIWGHVGRLHCPWRQLCPLTMTKSPSLGCCTATSRQLNSFCTTWLILQNPWLQPLWFPRAKRDQSSVSYSAQKQNLLFIRIKAFKGNQIFRIFWKPEASYFYQELQWSRAGTSLDFMSLELNWVVWKKLEYISNAGNVDSIKPGVNL